jgi:hypothetical protein
MMSYTVEDYLRETRQELLNSLTLEEILKGRSPQELVKAFSKALPTDEMEKSLPKEVLKAVDVIEEYLTEFKHKQ